ncbi:RrF2 family transcriptional regulator [Chitinophaga japonensis]|uniref:BadM/Rrf2 family transcriptional regulator n=1 Tax=Chitinophaga japonensis TaxID=104662 RepID=A0A562SSY4_CHIJA|nr:Rrf2 family transcriptional regulator [Chitinophaga japonensis]TWI84253.1 BadM/Rrf2 family transcriptional regulator [Chitinophaga japonensis]
MFSKTCEYAIRAVIFIAQATKDGGKVGIREIAKGIDAPEPFIAKILQELGRKQLLQSIKGPNGGFYLDKASLRRSLADIVVATDGEQLFSGCGLGLPQCSEAQPCPIHHAFKKVRNELHAMLEQAKIGTFTAQLEQNLTFLKRP